MVHVQVITWFYSGLCECIDCTPWCNCLIPWCHQQLQSRLL